MPRYMSRGALSVAFSAYARCRPLPAQGTSIRAAVLRCRRCLPERARGAGAGAAGTKAPLDTGALEERRGFLPADALLCRGAALARLVGGSQSPGLE